MSADPTAYLALPARVKEVQLSGLHPDSVMDAGAVVVVHQLTESATELTFLRFARDVLHRVGCGDSPIDHEKIPVLGLHGEGRRELHIARIAFVSDSNVIVVGLQQLDRLPSAWSTNVPALGTNFVGSIARRVMQPGLVGQGNAAEIAGVLVGEISSGSLRLLDAEIDNSVASVVRSTVREDATYEDRRTGFQVLFEARLRLHRALVLLRMEGIQDPITEQIEASIRSIDAAGTAMAAAANALLSEQFRHADEARGRAQDAAVDRDRELARIGAALLLPALWFGFLGINVLPEKVFGVEVQQWWVAVSTAAVGLLLAGIGWWGAPKLAHTQAAQKRTETQDEDD